jgi:hypothetical protein
VQLVLGLILLVGVPRAAPGTEQPPLPPAGVALRAGLQALADRPTARDLDATLRALDTSRAMLAAHLQGKAPRPKAATPSLRTLLDPALDLFDVSRGVLRLRPRHHRTLADAALALGRPHLALEHARAAQAGAAQDSNEDDARIEAALTALKDTAGLEAFVRERRTLRSPGRP